MIRNHTLAIGISACIMLAGCGDKIEEANQASVAPAAEAAAPAQPSAPAQPTSTAGHEHTDGVYSVADLYAHKADLAGKTVTVKGNVVKVSEAIMGKNWIHIQDGTGAEGTNDIVFTSASQSAAVGDQVTATGTVAIDKDFGYGYLYSVIVEEATFSK